MASTTTNVEMADLALPAKFNHASLGIDSPLWNDYQASDVFITPTVVSGEGITFLKSKVLAGALFMQDTIKGVLEHKPALEHDHKYLNIIKYIATQSPDDQASAGLIDHYNHDIGLFQERISLVEPFCLLAGKTADQYQALGRLCEQIEKMQSLHREALIRDPTQIARLTIAMKCLDATWRATAVLYKETKPLRDIMYTELDVMLSGEVDCMDNGVKKRVIRDNINGPYMMPGWQCEEDEEEEANNDSKDEVGGRANDDNKDQEVIVADSGGLAVKDEHEASHAAAKEDTIEESHALLSQKKDDQDR